MPTISEPQAPLNQTAFSVHRQRFIDGQYGEATFRVCLRLLGIPPRDIDSEVALAMMERKPQRSMV